jgi:hypothetical protein
MKRRFTIRDALLVAVIVVAAAWIWFVAQFVL